MLPPLHVKTNLCVHAAFAESAGWLGMSVSRRPGIDRFQPACSSQSEGLGTVPIDSTRDLNGAAVIFQRCDDSLGCVVSHGKSAGALARFSFVFREREPIDIRNWTLARTG